MRPRDRSLKSGFTLVETIISMSILVFLILALFTIMTSNLTALFNSKSRSIALNLAQEKIENLKNLSYDNLATQGGNIYPAGSIVDDEVIIRNNLRFRIHTDIRYIDNPYDGNALGTIPNKPTDLYSYDYKKATVEIYTATGTTKLAVLSTDVAAKAAETSSNTGVLIIRVIDASGSPVSNATVQVTNTNPNPDVTIQTSTDIQGQVALPKLPPDAATGYHVVITKSGYSSDQTYPIGAQYPAPSNPDFGLIVQQTTIKTFAIDALANLSLAIKNQSGSPLSNVAVTINGQKTINTSPAAYKTQLTSTTDSNGNVSFNLIDWDSYSVALAGYTILSSNPFNPISVQPNSFSSAIITAATTPTSYPVITAVSPNSSQAIAAVGIDITGANLNSGSVFLLRRSGSSDRQASSLVYSAPNTLSGNIDLTGAALGDWDLIVTTNGLSTTQTSALVVTP